MTVKITFEELSQYIAANFQKTFAFTQRSEKEIRVTFSQKVLFTTAKVNLDLAFDEARDADVAVTYNGGIGVDMIIAGALAYLENKVPEFSQAIANEGNHRVRIHLDKMKKTKQLVDAVALQSIAVEADGLVVNARLKS